MMEKEAENGKLNGDDSSGPGASLKPEASNVAGSLQSLRILGSRLNNNPMALNPTSTASSPKHQALHATTKCRRAQDWTLLI